MPSNLPLLRSEPVFRAFAEERNPGKVLFSHTVTDFKDEGDYVIVQVESRDGKQSTYRAKYLVGADGGKTIGPKLGIEMDPETAQNRHLSTLQGRSIAILGRPHVHCALC